MVLFRIAESLIKAGYDACVLIPGELYSEENKADYRPTWFKTDVPVTNRISDITSNDVVFIHEEAVWAFHELKKNNPRHVMINQGAQCTMCNEHISYADTKMMYQSALGVLVVSDYIADTLHTLFNIPKNKIFTLNNVNLISPIFKPGVKKNKILIMRKAIRVTNISNDMLVKIIRERYNWEVELVKDLTHEQMARSMAESKIFVFLCQDCGEGFGIPPFEAAISGCKVIGYSGLGGRSRYDYPNFTEIEYNDVNNFIKEVDYWVRELYHTNILEYSPRAEFVRDRLSRERDINYFYNDVKHAITRILNG
jgi:hypothetical protein